MKSEQIFPVELREEAKRLISQKSQFQDDSTKIILELLDKSISALYVSEEDLQEKNFFFEPIDVEHLALIDEEIIVYNDLNASLIGYAVRQGLEPVAVYDFEMLVSNFTEKQNMSMEECLEHISYNIMGAYLGERTPIILFRSI